MKEDSILLSVYPQHLTWHQNGSDGPPVSSPGHLLSVTHKQLNFATSCNFTVLRS